MRESDASASGVSHAGEKMDRNLATTKSLSKSDDCEIRTHAPKDRGVSVDLNTAD